MLFRSIRAAIRSLTMGSLLGVLGARWDRSRQTWHDKVADTYVIRRAGTLEVRPLGPQHRMSIADLVPEPLVTRRSVAWRIVPAALIVIASTAVSLDALSEDSTIEQTLTRSAAARAPEVAPGPPVVMYATSQGWEPRQVKANLQGFFMVNQTVALTGFWMSGLLTSQVLEMAVTFAIPSAVGLAIGMAMFGRVDAVKFRRMVYGLIFLSGVGLLLKGG